MPQSHMSWIVRAYMPLILAFGSLFLIFASAPNMSVRQMFFRILLLAPLIAAAAWMMIVPVDLEAHKKDTFVRIVRWQSSQVLSHDVIDYVSKGVLVCNKLYLKSGQILRYVEHEGNRHLTTAPALRA